MTTGTARQHECAVSARVRSCLLRVLLAESVSSGGTLSRRPRLPPEPDVAGDVFGGGLGRLVGPSRSREPAAADDDVVIGGHTLPQQTEVRSDFSSRSQFTVSRGKYSRPSTRCVVGASARVASFQTTRREPRLRVEVLRLVKELVMTSATTPTMTPSPGLSGIRQFDLAPCAADRMPRVHLDRLAPTPTPGVSASDLTVGRVNSKPCSPPSWTTSTEPPCLPTRSWTIDRPSPMPGRDIVASSTRREYGSNTDAESPSGTPSPHRALGRQRSLHTGSRRPGPSVLDGVVDEVGDDLPHPKRIGMNERPGCDLVGHGPGSGLHADQHPIDLPAQIAANLVPECRRLAGLRGAGLRAWRR